MGNSNTSRYADGKDLYHADAAVNQWLRALARAHPPTFDPRFLQAARRARTGAWEPTRRAVEQQPTPTQLAPRRAAGEVPRLLMDPEAGGRIRRIARRLRLDEGDVARVWAATIAAAPAASLPRLGLEAESA